MYRRLFYLMLTFSVITYAIQACNNSSTDTVGEDEVPDIISYNFHVRPILSDKCFACHGPDANKREAGLRLDIAEEAYKALKEKPSAHALVPFKPQESEVFLRISSQDSAFLMPPQSSNLKLTAYEISTIEKWIKQGAKYERHWAFTPPKKPAIPKVKNEEWVTNEIDHFILQKLEQKRLSLIWKQTRKDC